MFGDTAAVVVVVTLVTVPSSAPSSAKASSSISVLVPGILNILGVDQVSPS